MAAEPTPTELLVLDLESGRYYGLNAVAQLVWERLDGAATVAEIVDEIAHRFEVDAERVMNDVQELLADLLAQGLVVTAPPPI